MPEVSVLRDFHCYLNFAPMLKGRKRHVECPMYFLMRIWNGISFFEALILISSLAESPGGVELGSQSLATSVVGWLSRFTFALLCEPTGLVERPSESAWL